MSYATITQALEFSNKAVGRTGEKKTKDKKLISGKQERMKQGLCLELYVFPWKQDTGDRIWGWNSLGVFWLAKTPQTYILGTGTTPGKNALSEEWTLGNLASAVASFWLNGEIINLSITFWNVPPSVLWFWGNTYPKNQKPWFGRDRTPVTPGFCILKTPFPLLYPTGNWSSILGER